MNEKDTNMKLELTNDELMAIVLVDEVLRDWAEDAYELHSPNAKTIWRVYKRWSEIGESCDFEQIARIQQRVVKSAGRLKEGERSTDLAIRIAEMLVRDTIKSQKF